MLKAQADIISAIIIIIIAIGLVSSAYLWGLPLIQKKQDEALVKRVSNYFDQKNENSLSSKIEFIADNGGEDTFNLDVDGLWVLDPNENSMSFTFFSRVSDIGSAAWISLTGIDCPPSTNGIIGTHQPSVICARADILANGYNITYKIWFRQLDESGGARSYKIKLLNYQNPGSLTAVTSTSKSIRIFRGSINTTTQNLIITEIKILFG
jgi:hypothetical protein